MRCNHMGGLVLRLPRGPSLLRVACLLRVAWLLRVASLLRIAWLLGVSPLLWVTARLLHHNDISWLLTCDRIPLSCLMASMGSGLNNGYILRWGTTIATGFPAISTDAAQNTTNDTTDHADNSNVDNCDGPAWKPLWLAVVVCV